MSAKHIVRIHQGLGNQMFQYAFGRGMENRFGYNVAFETGSVGHRGQSPSMFETFVLAKASFVEYSEDVKRMQRVSDLPSSFCRYSEEFYRDVPCFYDGCWQHERYFNDMRGDIVTELKFPDVGDGDEGTLSKLYRIRTSECPVAVHVRRGDYVRRRWDLGMRYFAESMDYMRGRLARPTFFVFGQDMEWINGNFSKFDDVVLMGGSEIAWHDMFLISCCRHAIISNSTFAWWGVWLGKCRDGLVICPEPWVKGICGADCEGWIKHVIYDRGGMLMSDDETSCVMYGD